MLIVYSHQLDTFILITLLSTPGSISPLTVAQPIENRVQAGHLHHLLPIFQKKPENLNTESKVIHQRR